MPLDSNHGQLSRAVGDPSATPLMTALARAFANGEFGQDLLEATDDEWEMALVYLELERVLFVQMVWRDRNRDFDGSERIRCME